MSVAHSWQAIAGLRILLGCAESFLQIAGLYLTFFYKRNELATRGSIYFATSAVAGSANGLLSYAILKDLNGASGWLAWRWIFLIEGESKSCPGALYDYLADKISRPYVRSLWVSYFCRAPCFARETWTFL
jgi:MFS family permease